jgi:hypothetical protein
MSLILRPITHFCAVLRNSYSQTAQCVIAQAQGPVPASLAALAFERFGHLYPVSFFIGVSHASSFDALQLVTQAVSS